jgi:hypothetical protein
MGASACERIVLSIWERMLIEESAGVVLMSLLEVAFGQLV